MSYYFEMNQVTPLPLVGVTDFKSQVWGKDVGLSEGVRYLLYAPSGKGKSTFIHLLYGLRDDYQGTVKINGLDRKTFAFNDWSELRQSQLSIMFQDLRLFGDLTAWENLEVKFALPGAVSENRVEEWLDRLQIGSLTEKPAKHLSYGERQRFAIIRALIQPFKFILLDEPFAHLDHENAERACALIDERCKELNAGFVLTSLEEHQPLKYDKIVNL